ncbi:hypothetical protein BCR33DRAFT_720652 [Rhizoclosmatium globosum]|uniref:Uncharacterized protein n=1 Tax=Rhizoclosmatium globosum TaxID=329046 RepID=A0A1Y2BV39_9FUNG|nr:hypothetical protein BCR33DRAFT_720652 [Rhizoclosmatium globosum]|eukprot:ORY38642.1 hypothetical protein BCR33DRAFT_720652 [Rhizoclosmatium globosum]
MKIYINSHQPSFKGRIPPQATYASSLLRHAAVAHIIAVYFRRVRQSRGSCGRCRLVGAV